MHKTVFVSSLSLLAVGIGFVMFVLLMALANPQWVEHTVGDSVTRVKHEITTTVAGKVPSIQLGVVGGQAEVDWCDGTFIEIATYQDAGLGLPPTFTAHNGCGGDAILPLAIGDRLEVINRDGTSKEYAVTDHREMLQGSDNLQPITGMGGDLVVQTCYWDGETMKFLSLSEIEVI